MISHVSWYLLFVGWILLAQVNMIDVVTQGQIGADVYDYLAFVWAFGFTISDIQMVYQLSQVSELQVLTFAISWMHYIFFCLYLSQPKAFFLQNIPFQSVKMKKANYLELFIAKLKKAFSNAYIDYRIISHLTLIAGFIIEFAGFRRTYKLDDSGRLDSTKCTDPDDNYRYCQMS